VDLFIAAAAALKQMLPDRKVRFVWAGSHYPFDQPYFDALQQQLRESGLNTLVELLGELHDLDPVYRRADVFLLSSRLDPLPNVAIDSALRGLPIVCFDQTSGIAELLMKHEDPRGLVVPHLDATAAAAAMRKPATDPAALHHVSTAIAVSMPHQPLGPCLSAYRKEVRRECPWELEIFPKPIQTLEWEIIGKGLVGRCRRPKPRCLGQRRKPAAIKQLECTGGSC
jgi:glycosyltransferase involved in cell wall biosynthesis